MRVSTTVHVNLPKLSEQHIPVSPNSLPELIQENTGAGVWYGIFIDGAFYPLTSVKEATEDAERMVALRQALGIIGGVITNLRFPAGTIVRWFRSNGPKSITQFRGVVQQIEGGAALISRPGEGLMAVPLDRLELDLRSLKPVVTPEHQPT